MYRTWQTNYREHSRNAWHTHKYRKTPYTGMVTLMRNTTPPQRTLLIFQYLFEDKELKAGTFFEQDVNMRESFQ